MASSLLKAVLLVLSVRSGRSIDALLAVKIDYSRLGGPGQELLGNIAMGHTIALETFVTQFILDIEAASGVAAHRIYVLNVTEGDVHFSWRWASTMVKFRMIDDDAAEPSVIDAVRNLTQQTQLPLSPLLKKGNVTSALDAHWGIVALDWDASLRLAFSIDVIAPELAELNKNKATQTSIDLGALRYCDQKYESNQSAYCEWEFFFEHDIASALDISPQDVDLLAVRPAAPDAVLAHFRLIPNQTKTTIMGRLLAQVRNSTSVLFKGNVTVRVDPAWGVSGIGAAPRKASSVYLPYAVRGDSSLPYHGFGAFTNTSGAAYERCKATHRCARGYVHYDMGNGSIRYTTQVFAGGRHERALLFANFEDHALGSRGWHLRGGKSPIQKNLTAFKYRRLVPAPHVAGIERWGWCHERQPCQPRWYSGLIVNEQRRSLDIARQSALVANIQADLNWLELHASSVVLDADGARSRADALKLSAHRAADIRSKLQTEQSKLNSLVNAPCNQSSPCVLSFNTSSLKMSGILNATGEIGYLPDGVEAAVFAFDEIEIGPEVNISCMGQRPLVLASRSSILFNTTLAPFPGTVGGFLGGFSIGKTQLLSDEPADMLVGHSNENVSSYNVNGPGSPSLRIRLLTLTSRADYLPQQIRLTLSCDEGERVDGVFRIGYRDSWSRWLAPSASASTLRLALDQDLNYKKDLDRSVGFVNVTRLASSDWLLTMATARNFVELLVDTTRLEGRGAVADTKLIRAPNVIGGTFRFVWESNENSTKTRWLHHDVAADQFATALLEDISELQSATVTSPILHNAQNGAPGLVWSLTLTSVVDNPTPSTPAQMPLFTEHRVLRVETNLTGVNASLALRGGLSKSHRGHLSELNQSIFSLAYGGAGAGYGGRGGGGITYASEGAGLIARRDASGKITLTTAAGGDGYTYNAFTGGSGGALGYAHPFLVSTLGEAGSLPARGGAGGGALMFVAENDIRLGSMSRIAADGGTGSSGHLAGGGGGSGGSILLQAGGVLRLDKGFELSARGGSGGDGATASGGGGGGGRVQAFASAQSVDSMRLKADVFGGTCASDSSRNGEDGEIHAYFTSGGVRYEADTDFGGAFGTSGTLRIKAMDATREATSVSTSLSFQGPEYHFSSADEQPERLSFVVRIDSASSSTREAAGSWGAALLLYDSTGQESLQSANSTVAVGIALSDALRHASGFSGSLQQHLGASQFSGETNIILSGVREQRWYKIDVFFDWSRHVYDVLVDDVLRLDDARLHADSISRLGAYAWGGRGEVRFDEIFLGPDHTMGFRCPRAKRSGVETEVSRPIRRGWDDQDSRSSFEALSKHHNHVSRREVYAHSNGGLKPFDGEGHMLYRSEVGNDLDELPAKINAGGLLRLQDGSAASASIRMRATTSASKTNAHDVRGSFGDLIDDLRGHTAPEYNYSETIRLLYNSKNDKSAATYFWYGEHNNPDENADPWLKGGVGACATDDMIHWRSYGIVLHYANLTDMVHTRDAWLPGCDGYSTRFGSDRGYGCIGAEGLHAIRPRVLLAHLGHIKNYSFDEPYFIDHYSAQDAGHGYVMWMGLEEDNQNYSLALAAVASASYASGPFSFRRSMYPDGNTTRDQAVWTTDSDNELYSLLGRSYYADVEYVLPSAQMQPVWQHVHSSNGEIDFGLSYHRGIYLRDYDDYHDIYLQRWRLEDKPWLVLCVNRYNHMDNFSVPRGESFGEDGAACPDPDYYKLILGQGYSSEQGKALGVSSRFMDPALVNNSAWRPNSVPAVKAQPWANNYLDGDCGRGSADNDYDLNDPSLPDRTIKDRSNCSNARDNPVHETRVDDLVGSLKIVETRRVKFVAVSSLTPDLLDTSSVLNVLEGGLEDRLGASALELDALLSENFDWNFRSHGNEASTSTFQPPLIAGDVFPDLQPVPASVSRYHQYHSRYNDRAFHSLGCVFDGDCPVNFLDQTPPAVDGRYG